MKNFLPHILIFTLGVGAIVFIWLAPQSLGGVGSGSADRFEHSSISNATIVESSESTSSSNDNALTSPVVDSASDIPHQTPLTRSAEHPAMVNGAGFRMTVPMDWMIEGYDGVAEDGEFGTMSFGKKPEDAYLSDSAVTIDVMSFARPANLEKEIQDRKMVSVETRASMIAYMSSKQPNVGLGAKDILLFDAQQPNLGVFPVYRTGFQCLKACYPEGLPPTRYSYFVDTGATIYQFDVEMTTSKQTVELLKRAEAVIQSFRLK